MSRLIDADKLKDAVYESFAPYQMEWARTIHQIQKVIDEQPPVEAVPVVRGEWEKIPYSFAGGYRCSCCGQKTLEKHWKFCPNCGADMERRQNRNR